MLSEIYSEYTYWKDRDELQNGGWFFSTVENMYYNNPILAKEWNYDKNKELTPMDVLPNSEKKVW
jgi:hypothetical protein